MLEREVEAHFAKQVRAKGGRSWKLKFLGVSGAPDRLVVLPGPRVHLVELKRPVGGIVSFRQRSIHRILAALDWPVLILCSKAEVDEWISSI